MPPIGAEAAERLAFEKNRKAPKNPCVPAGYLIDFFTVREWHNWPQLF
jgi:hypothetical protein